MSRLGVKAVERWRFHMDSSPGTRAWVNGMGWPCPKESIHRLGKVVSVVKELGEQHFTVTVAVKRTPEWYQMMESGVPVKEKK